MARRPRQLLQLLREVRGNTGDLYRMTELTRREKILILCSLEDEMMRHSPLKKAHHYQLFNDEFKRNEFRPLIDKLAKEWELK